MAPTEAGFWLAGRMCGHKVGEDNSVTFMIFNTVNDLHLHSSRLILSMGYHKLFNVLWGDAKYALSEYLYS